MQAVQLDLLLEPSNRGGRRDGAGRPKLKGKRDAAHRVRPKVSRHVPQHVVLRTRADVPRLRRGRVLRAMQHALNIVLERTDFRVVQVSIQHNHLHLIVEADDRDALTSGMQGLAIAAARAINRVCERSGKVFAFRYHATPIKSPQQARNALAYVLNNWRRHREDARTGNERWLVDKFSSAVSFDGWHEVSGWTLPVGYKPLPVASPSSWLLRVGWQKHPRISIYERPGALR